MKVLPIFLSALSTEENVLSMEDKFSLSGEMLLKGMGTVFMVLLLLWGILAVFGLVFGEKQKKPAPKPTPAPKPEPKQATEPTAAPAPVADNGALVAAITAAIEAYRSSEGKGALPFRVVSFKRKNGAAGWNGNASEN